MQRRNKIELLTNGKKLIEFYRNHPCIAAYELLGVELAPIQRLVFRDMWFKDYVITVASRGFGKCVSTDSMSYFNDTGLVYLHEVIPKLPDFLREGEDLVLKLDKKILTSEGFKSTKNICFEKSVVGKKLVTQIGLVNKCNKHHPILTITNDGAFVYKEVENLNRDDKVCIQRNKQCFGSKDVDNDYAYLLGLFIGSNDNQILTTTIDSYINSFYISYCDANNIPPKIKENAFSDDIVNIKFEPFEVFFNNSKDNNSIIQRNEVPFIIRTATRNTQIAFIQGYFDACGIIDVINNRIKCSSKSYRLLKELQLLLLNFGIISILKYNKLVYNLSIYGNDVVKFAELIGFRSVDKQSTIESYNKDNTNEVCLDYIPYSLSICTDIIKACISKYPDLDTSGFDAIVSGTTDLTYEKLHKFLEQCNKVAHDGFDLSIVKDKIDKLYTILTYYYYFDTVVSVDDWRGDCYDFEMDMEDDIEPNYFSNGFINHNTFILGTLAALSCLLYPGYRVGLIGPAFRQSIVISSAYDTFWTSDGLITSTKKLFNNVEEGITKVQSQYYQNTILSKWKNDERDCIEIKTTKGFELSGTADHKILFLDIENGEICFKELCDLNNGDRILIKSGFNYFGDNNILPTYDFKCDWCTNDCTIPLELTLDLSYLFGLLIGGGCVSIDNDRRKYKVTFINNNQELLEVFENTMLEYFNITVTDRTKRNGCYQITYYCEKLVLFLVECGFIKTTTLDKRIPYVIKRASKECFVGFIQGLMDTEGCCYVQVYKNGRDYCEVTLNTSSKQLAKEYQSFLLNVGIVSNLIIDSSICKKQLLGRDKVSKCVETYKVRIIGRRNLEIFNSESLFKSERKKAKLNNYIKNHFNSAVSVAYCLGLPQTVVDKNVNVYRNYLEQGYYFVKVKSKKHMFAKTMDIEVENESCYFSSGFISHNSKMIFSEVEKLYNQSSILREASAKKPTNASDKSFLLFKSVAGKTPSYIESLPLGDGCLTNNNYSTFYDRFDTIGSSHNLDIEENHYIDRKEVVWGNGKFRQSDRSLCNGKKKTIKIKTKKGFYSEGTANHKFKLVRDGRIVWCRFDDMVVGDRVLIDRSYRWHKGNSDITEEQAYSLGFLIGDGCWTDKTHRLGFATLDKELLPLLRQGIGCDYLFLAVDGVHYFACSYEKHITQNDIRKEWMKFWEIDSTYAINKKFPKKILSASRRNMTAAIRGLFDADGHVQVCTAKGGISITIGFTNTSEELIDQLHYILLHYGIVAVKVERERNDNWNTLYELLITGKDTKIFYDEIGFGLWRKNHMLKEAIDSKLNWLSYEDIPGIQNIMVDISSTNRIKKGYGTKGSRYCRASILRNKKYITPYIVNCFLEAYGHIDDDRIDLIMELNNDDIYYDEIVEITYGEDVTYDIHIPNGHEYCANGFFSHNSKIRGSRFYLVLVDELAQMKDQLLDMVVRPMGATSLAPMERVNRLKEQRRLIEAGLAEESDFDEEKVNKMVMTSSGYYKFNHMWRRMRDYWKMIADAEAHNKESEYAVWQVPYWDLPKGFLDEKNIEEAKRIMSTHEFKIEYEAAMVSDSEGFFKASLLDDCTLDSGFTIMYKGNPNKQYIIGIDPNQGGADSCGAIVAELGKVVKLVNVMELKHKTTQDLTKIIQSLSEQYNVIRIFMDKGGGGKAIMDLLEDGYGDKTPILDRTNADNIQKNGRHILEMVNFNPTWIADANFTTKAMFEDKSLRFPELFSTASDLVAKSYKTIHVLKSQLLSIVVTQTSSGFLHFDTPAKNMQKDLYSALILVAHGARQIERELEEDSAPILHSSGGLVRPHGAGNTFNSLNAVTGLGVSIPLLSNLGLNAAVLKKKK